MRVALSVLFALGLLMMTSAAAFADTATATVDGNCTLVKATITVPAGKTASGFALSKLEPGTKCKVGGTPDVKGWGILSGSKKVYYWSQFQSKAPTETGGPLSSVSLAPGTYHIFVDGGAGARAVVTYTVK